jgi:hypothetical protein
MTAEDFEVSVRVGFELTGISPEGNHARELEDLPERHLAPEYASRRQPPTSSALPNPSPRASYNWAFLIFALKCHLIERQRPVKLARSASSSPTGGGL